MRFAGLYKKNLEKGLEGSVRVKVDIPARGRWRILGRVRGMSGLERSSYTTGWPPSGEAGRGSFRVNVEGREAGEIKVEGYTWKWIEADGAGFNASKGTMEIEFSTSDAGIALDNIIVTNDAKFIPSNGDNTPTARPSIPGNLKIRTLDTGEEETLKWRGYTLNPPCVMLEWEESEAPQGIRYYNVYRSSEENFRAGYATLIGSPSEPFFLDPELEKGKEYRYRVVGVDNWDNRSEPSGEATIKIE